MLFNQSAMSYREPDSTYYELPPGSQQGERPVPSTSTPGCHCSATESSMDVYHLRDMNDNVMVGQQAPFLAATMTIKQNPNLS